MKNERFERYIYMGVTAILVLIAAVFVVFLFLERAEALRHVSAYQTERRSQPYKHVESTLPCHFP